MNIRILFSALAIIFAATATQADPLIKLESHAGYIYPSKDLTTRRKAFSNIQSLIGGAVSNDYSGEKQFRFGPAATDTQIKKILEAIVAGTMHSPDGAKLDFKKYRPFFPGDAMTQDHITLCQWMADFTHNLMTIYDNNFRLMNDKDSFLASAGANTPAVRFSSGAVLSIGKAMYYFDRNGGYNAFIFALTPHNNERRLIEDFKDSAHKVMATATTNLKELETAIMPHIEAGSVHTLDTGATIKAIETLKAAMDNIISNDIYKSGRYADIRHEAELLKIKIDSQLQIFNHAVELSKANADRMAEMVTQMKARTRARFAEIKTYLAKTEEALEFHFDEGKVHETLDTAPVKTLLDGFKTMLDTIISGDAYKAEAYADVRGEAAALKTAIEAKWTGLNKAIAESRAEEERAAAERARLAREEVERKAREEAAAKEAAINTAKVKKELGDLSLAIRVDLAKLRYYTTEAKTKPLNTIDIPGRRKAFADLRDKPQQIVSSGAFSDEAYTETKAKFSDLVRKIDAELALFNAAITAQEDAARRAVEEAERKKREAIVNARLLALKPYQDYSVMLWDSMLPKPAAPVNKRVIKSSADGEAVAMERMTASGPRAGMVAPETHLTFEGMLASSLSLALYFNIYPNLQVLELSGLKGKVEGVFSRIHSATREFWSVSGLDKSYMVEISPEFENHLATKKFPLPRHIKISDTSLWDLESLSFQTDGRGEPKRGSSHFMMVCQSLSLSNARGDQAPEDFFTSVQKALVFAVNLERLDLSRNDLTTLPILNSHSVKKRGFSQLGRLAYIDLSGNKLSVDELTAFVTRIHTVQKEWQKSLIEEIIETLEEKHDEEFHSLLNNPDNTEEDKKGVTDYIYGRLKHIKVSDAIITKVIEAASKGEEAMTKAMDGHYAFRALNVVGNGIDDLKAAQLLRTLSELFGRGHVSLYYKLPKK